MRGHLNPAGIDASPAPVLAGPAMSSGGSDAGLDVDAYDGPHAHLEAHHTNAYTGLLIDGWGHYMRAETVHPHRLMLAAPSEHGVA